ncbi:hypothetical protein ACFSCV_08680 [Methylopila henanensis]|uniref:DUF2946 domain-containing protein n=1 Tax=Methylopila henanensis TaxID=873516 RepID=A0ABW4K972_9HYPH
MIRGLLLAYLLVIQAALGGVAIGSLPVAAAEAALVDCISAHSSNHAPAKGHGALPGCCVAACQLHGGSSAPPPSFATAPVSGDVQLVRTPAEARAAAPVILERSPRSTRGPPALA